MKYFNNLTDVNNLKYYAYVDTNISFIIRLFNSSAEFKNLIDVVKESLMKLVKWMKENPYPPTMAPVKHISMYKKRTTNFPNRINNIQFNNFVTKYTAISNDKINKLTEIIKSKHFLNYLENLTNTKSENVFDSDVDLTDFKFSIGDKVKFE